MRKGKASDVWLSEPHRGKGPEISWGVPEEELSSVITAESRNKHLATVHMFNMTLEKQERMPPPGPVLPYLGKL